MKINHLGAKNCVTGSCHLMQTRPGSADGTNILVDCGKAYGHDPELPFDQFPVQPDRINYLFLTHAHIDHIGRVPDLIDAGFRGEIICTHATKALLIPMLHDAITGYSAHADQNMLVDWVKSMPTPPGEIRLVHGESHARHALARALE